MCRELRRSAMSPRQLNGVLDCLEGVDRLQDQLVQARRELTNLAIFGNKAGRQRGDANTSTAAAVPQSPAARRWKKTNKRRAVAAAAAHGGNGASRRTAKRKQQRQRARARAQQQRASPDAPIKVEEESDVEDRGNAIRAPLQDIALPNRAVGQRLDWQK